MDFKKYHVDWRDVIRPAILKRDGYCCKRCGIRHKSRVTATKSGTYKELDSFEEIYEMTLGKKVFTLYLNVAHLDHNKENNEPENLLTLCPKCHAKNDAKVKKFVKIKYNNSIVTAKANIQVSNPMDARERNFKIKALVKQLCGFTISIQEAANLFDAMQELK